MIIYNGKSSYTDFDLYVAAKEIPAPQRKVITETVPYMSGVWDFSYHDNGVDEYEAVTLKYSFDVIADTKRELAEQKAALLAWLHKKADGKLYDTDISLTEFYEVYHAQAEWSETDLQGLLSVSFTCYPFRKTETEAIKQTLSSTAKDINITLDSFRAIMPVITVSGTAKLTIGSSVYNLGAGVYDNIITLEAGTNKLTVSGSGEITVEYWAEVL